jgi:hypothetical protein
MNPTETKATMIEAGREQSSLVPSTILLLAALAISCSAVSRQSFWIDEVAAVTKAAQPTLAGWWQLMESELGSDRQMPLYMLFLWVWEKVFHHGEWMTRASGIPWVIAGLWVFSGRRPDRWIAATLSSFTWYCLDEARPYAMQLGAALALFGSLERLAKPPVPATSPPNRIWITVFAASLIVLSGSSLLGMIWAAAAIAAFLGIQNRGQPLGFLREHFALWLMTGLLLAGLTAYYGWTIRAGSRATPGTTDWRNILFAAFELLGFTGLGPGRLELRNVGVSALRAYLLPLAAIASLCGLVACAGFSHSRKELLSRLGRYLFLVIAGAIALLVAIGLLKHFRLLGRHFTPVAPVAFWVLAQGISALWQTRKLIPRTIVAAFLILNVASCLSLRLAARHGKDDYRGTAAFARTALQSGRTVWWNADPGGGRFYGVPIPDTIATFVPGSAVGLWNASRVQLLALPTPDVVIVSKPDLFDSQGSVAEFLKQQHYRQTDQRQAFSIWRSANEPR